MVDQTEDTQAEETQQATPSPEPAPAPAKKAAVPKRKKKSGSRQPKGAVEKDVAAAGTATPPLKPVERTIGHPDAPK